MNREQTLKKANDLIHNSRNDSYGDPVVDFSGIATFWSVYLGVEIKPHDVAAMMILLKIGRMRFSPEIEDGWIDIAGYAGCGCECVDLEDEYQQEFIQPKRSPKFDYLDFYEDES